MMKKPVVVYCRSGHEADGETTGEFRVFGKMFLGFEWHIFFVVCSQNISAAREKAKERERAHILYYLNGRHQTVPVTYFSQQSTQHIFSAAKHLESSFIYLYIYINLSSDISWPSFDVSSYESCSVVVVFQMSTGPFLHPPGRLKFWRILSSWQLHVQFFSSLQLCLFFLSMHSLRPRWLWPCLYNNARGWKWQK